MIHGIDTSMLVACEVASHSLHLPARALLSAMDQRGDRFALAPQVLAEFVHIVTDSRRCSTPLTMQAALQRAESIWNATQVMQVYPSAACTAQFFQWMHHHRLGRKRLLDTMLAATYWSAGTGSILTLNPSDFAIFGCFSLLQP